jgi:hypothetical protein
MTIPQPPPDDLPEEPGTEIPPEGPTPETPPSEYPQTDEPDWRAPGSSEDYDAPMRMPSDNPDVETEL